MTCLGCLLRGFIQPLKKVIRDFSQDHFSYTDYYDEPFFVSVHGERMRTNAKKFIMVSLTDIVIIILRKKH